MAERILFSRNFREEGYRPCLGLVRLMDEHGATRLEEACRQGIERGVNQYRRVKEILLAMPRDEPGNHNPIQHENVRGADYYAQAMTEEG
jgi:hypothetical protein